MAGGIQHEAAFAPSMVQSGSMTSRYRRKAMLSTPNDIWKDWLKGIEKYLDVASMMNLRLTARIFYSHKYRIGNGHLSFLGFRGYDSKVLCESLLPVACRAIHASQREEGISLDFTSCTLIKDASLARIMKAICGDWRYNAILAKVKELHFDFCYQITDNGLAAMLTTSLPYLEKLSVRCARSKELSGSPFCNLLSETYWPSFVDCDCSFSDLCLDSVLCIAGYLTDSAGRNKRDPAYFPHIRIYGSLASKSFCERVFQGPLLKSFSNAIVSRNHELVYRLTKKSHKELLALSSSSTSEHDCSVLIKLVKNRGSELLVNSPLTADSSVGGAVKMWTLPICMAMENGDLETFKMLLKRGAKVDVWDHMRKSPLFRASEGGRTDFAEIIIHMGASTTPYDLNGYSALDVAIKSKNSNMVELLLKNGGVLNHRCSSLSKYKSALFVACEANVPEIIRLFLLHGADPNWHSPTNFTPTLLAYQLDSAWLPQFLEAGAGASRSNRWVLGELLSCAISKGDLDSVKLLVERYPDLLSRTHHLWSLPHIQAVKLGKELVLKFLLENGSNVNAAGEGGATALHVATGEGNAYCVKLLLSMGADINKQMTDGLSAIHTACLENRGEVADILLLAKCNVNCLDKYYSETPLMSSIRTRNHEMSMRVLKRAENLDYNAQDGKGRTALMYAFFFGQYEIADILLSNGANIIITDSFGVSTRTIVCERMMNPGGLEKRVLKRFLRLYKAQCSGRYNSGGCGGQSLANNTVSNFGFYGHRLCSSNSSTISGGTTSDYSSNGNSHARSSGINSNRSNSQEAAEAASWNRSNTGVNNCIIMTSRNHSKVASKGARTAIRSYSGDVDSSETIFPLHFDLSSPLSSTITPSSSEQPSTSEGSALETAQINFKATDRNSVLVDNGHPSSLVDGKQSADQQAELGAAKYDRKVKIESRSVISVVKHPITLLRAAMAK